MKPNAFNVARFPTPAPQAMNLRSIFFKSAVAEANLEPALIAEGSGAYWCGFFVGQCVASLAVHGDESKFEADISLIASETLSERKVLYPDSKFFDGQTAKVLIRAGILSALAEYSLDRFHQKKAEESFSRFIRDFEIYESGWKRGLDRGRNSKPARKKPGNRQKDVYVEGYKLRLAGATYGDIARKFWPDQFPNNADKATRSMRSGVSRYARKVNNPTFTAL